MAGTLTDLVDAIAADLEALALPAHSLWKYADPPVIRPDLGRMLGVFPRATDFQIEATNSSYEDYDRIIVAWYEPLLASPETGGAGDPAVAKDALVTTETILARLRTYGVIVPNLAGQSEASVESARYGLIVGTTTWAAEITLKVTRWFG